MKNKRRKHDKKVHGWFALWSSWIAKTQNGGSFCWIRFSLPFSFHNEPTQTQPHIWESMKGSVYFLGQILGASGFPNKNAEVWCRFKLSFGTGWEHAEGVLDGSTQTSSPQVCDGFLFRYSRHSSFLQRDGTLAVWAHPFDISFRTSTMVGWPKLDFEVWQADSLGRQQFCT
jgi:hypothetical protein